MQRKKAFKTGSQNDLNKFKDLHCDTKRMIVQRKKDSHKMKVALRENPKRFWSYVKSITNQNSAIIFLRNGQSFITNSYTKANLLNKFFHSVFAADHVYLQTI